MDSTRRKSIGNKSFLITTKNKKAPLGALINSFYFFNTSNLANKPGDIEIAKAPMIPNTKPKDTECVFIPNKKATPKIVRAAIWTIRFCQCGNFILNLVPQCAQRTLNGQ